MRAPDGNDKGRGLALQGVTAPNFQFTLTAKLARQIGIILPVLLGGAVQPALAGTPTSCASLSTFSYQNTTINSASSQPGGPYVAPDAWHLAFTNLPPYCDVSATIKPTADSSINVRVWMPTTNYNGRYLGTGNGGYAGGFFFSELADGKAGIFIRPFGLLERRFLADLRGVGDEIVYIVGHG